MKNLILATVVVIISLPALAQKPEVYSTEAGAIAGYDPVAYFKESKPVLGKTEMVSTYNGAVWHFANAENKAAFDANPGKYAPQYGGYCAYGTSQGHKAPTKPEAWTIVNGKLYLNYNTQVQTEWQKKTATLIPQADEKWPTVKKE